MGFEPTILVSERPQTHALDRTATGIGIIIIIIIIIIITSNTMFRSSRSPSGVYFVQELKTQGKNVTFCEKMHFYVAF
jgi:uncharacterized protein YpmB